jgi:hypothetical protein
MQLTVEAVIYGIQKWKQFFKGTQTPASEGIDCYLEGSTLTLIILRAIKNDSKESWGHGSSARAPA